MSQFLARCVVCRRWWRCRNHKGRIQRIPCSKECEQELRDRQHTKPSKQVELEAMREEVEMLKRLIAKLSACIVMMVGVHGATIQANSPSQPDVQAAVSASATGDIVLVPAGLSVWTNRVMVVDRGITLRGAGTNSSGGTIIVDENPASRSSQPSLLDIIWQRTNGGMFDLSGFQFRGGTNQTGTLIVGTVRLKASNNMTNDSVWRIHNNWWNDPYGRPWLVRAWSGLIDSNTFSLTHHLAGNSIDNRIQAGEYGDRSWAEDVPRGTTNLVYFEHNKVDATGTPRAIMDAFGGARYVARYNNIRNRSFENHGTESTQRTRSARWMEIYGNTMLQDGGAGEYANLIRGGSGVIFSNTLTGPWPGLLRSIYALSLQSHSPWTMANGTNVWDVNVAGGPFETGTHTGSDGTIDLTDNTKTWTTNQWQGYSIINYSQSYDNPVGTQNRAGLITDNIANTISTFQTAIANQILLWTNGDTYMIWKVDKALDAMGRGTGDLLVGGSSSVPPTPIGYPNELNDPVYLWSNTVTNVAVGVYPLIEGRDWTNGVARPGYTPLINPHPLAGSGTNAPPVPVPPVPPVVRPPSMLRLLL